VPEMALFPLKMGEIRLELITPGLLVPVSHIHWYNHWGLVKFSALVSRKGLDFCTLQVIFAPSLTSSFYLDIHPLRVFTSKSKTGVQLEANSTPDMALNLFIQY
jgi:hypothetical protein